MDRSIVFVDSEIGVDDNKIYDLGGISSDNNIIHTKNINELKDFISNYDFICGHNILNHDIKYIGKAFNNNDKVVDTLYLSPLLFPKNPYHALLKDDKLTSDDLNNPVNDSKKAMQLFYDEVNAFHLLNNSLKEIFYYLLSNTKEFRYFFEYIDFSCEKCSIDNIKLKIDIYFKGKICENANIKPFIVNQPIALAYVLSLINADDIFSITPAWVFHQFPETENIKKILLDTPCSNKCIYCDNKLNIHKSLRNIFGYNEFRKFSGSNLQEQAVQAAVDNKSLLTIFPTGGGKSITFQLPAIMAGRNYRGLTVVISPLQSLMKDQVDNLNNIGIHDAVTINGLLNGIERAEAIERVYSGKAHILYISPESLRSKTIERLLEKREVARFVIDEAHCFSAWGQDFRVDYLYIGDFILKYQKKKKYKEPIPVSCFTATAKQKVITDICDYFLRKNNIELQLFASNQARENLKYKVLYKETDEEKYYTLRDIIISKKCPTIVYVSRTRKTVDLANRLTADGIEARPFNGKMDSQEKIKNQEEFINNEVEVMIATSAFGMGVDKKDIKLVIHYDISDSLENYIQEAGRAGRDPNLEADCYILYSDNDLNKHFILLNQTKLTLNEIQGVWKAIKNLTKRRKNIACSALEIAREAGWENDNINEIETRVKTAIAALEHAGFIERGLNYPKIYATSILPKSMSEVSNKIENSKFFSDNEKQDARRIMSRLFSSKSIAKAGNDESESRVDYLSDILGMEKANVISIINSLRQEDILRDDFDIAAYIYSEDNENKSLKIVNEYMQIEEFLINKYSENVIDINLKEINTEINKLDIKSTEKKIRTLIYYHTIKNYIKKEEDKESKIIKIYPTDLNYKLLERFNKKVNICGFIINYLFEKSKYCEVKTEEKINDKIEQIIGKEENKKTNKKINRKEVWFSVISLLKEYSKIHKDSKVELSDIEDALLYLSKISALTIEGGFLVLYNAMSIKRLKENIRYKVADYEKLNEFYKNKIQQIHIVGEYANLMVKDYNAALGYVFDYFNIDYKKFINKYFKGERKNEIEKGITKELYKKIYDELSDAQNKILNDTDSKYIVVAAGPGSGKTRLLVHKLAAILTMEDVKHEQLLMLTFSRAAAVEFKKRLIDLIGNAAHYVDVKTFHSYCFDLMGIIGSLDKVENVIKEATDMIRNNDVELGKILKHVLVIDEAQDMSQEDFDLVSSLINRNEDMRVIAVGDDDQNIYSFRGSDSKYLKSLIDEKNATKYEMVENYRSKKNIILFANNFVKSIKNRMKEKELQVANKNSVNSNENKLIKTIKNIIKSENLKDSNNDGIVEVIEYKSDNFIIPAINRLISTENNGSICVLTKTNDEALQVLSLLLKNGIKATLIQSLGDGFKLINLVEIRYFLKKIDKNLNSPIISNEIWDKAINQLKEKYEKSSCLEICLNVINDFSKINKVKYRRDFEEYLRESSYEDFYDYGKEKIIISTIHKSKGHEFDNVYMLLSNYDIRNDDEKRKLYVGMTRAKNKLSIHTTLNIFKNYIFDDVYYKVDTNRYNELDELIIRLTHKSVYLSSFKGKKNIIFSLRSGEKLLILDGGLGIKENNKIIKLLSYSKNMKSKIDNLLKNGFKIYDANIQFILAWKNDDNIEIPIILPNLYFKKY